MRRYDLIVLFLLLQLIIHPVSAFAGLNPSYLIAMRANPAYASSHFTFIFTQHTVGRIAVLSQPDRVILELKNARKEFDLEDLLLKNSNVSAIESEELPNHTLRFIFFVKSKVKAQARFSANQQQLTLDIRSLPQQSVVQTQSKTRASFKVITIVIDPGHGGSDPGAKGIHGSLEKNIVLAIAKRLADKFNREANVHVVLTRGQDHFVPLRERLTLARKSKADLFIAIHADAYYHQFAQGASVYALSQHGATSEAAHWLAKQDNYSELGGVELNALYDKSPILRKVLIDLAQTATIKSSLTLGNHILRSLDDIASLHHNQVEQAPFLVLKSPDIPSILIETGFISNPVEEMRLKNPYYQNKIANALYRGVLRYIKDLKSNM